METPPEELLTIAQAARRLGVSIPRLRRALARPEYAGRTRTSLHETRTGTRTGTSLPESFLLELESFFRPNNPVLSVKPAAENESGNESINRNGNESGTDPNDSDTVSNESGTSPAWTRREADTPAPLPGELTPLYQRIIAEQAARIADLQAALDSERAAAARLSDNLKSALDTAGRAQALQAIAPPRKQQRPAWWTFWRREKRG